MKEMQIKEIAEVIRSKQGCGRRALDKETLKIVANEDVAEALYNAGYRKQPLEIAELKAENERLTDQNSVLTNIATMNSNEVARLNAEIRKMKEEQEK